MRCNFYYAEAVNPALNEQLQEQRINFELPWNRYHMIRTYAAVLSFTLSILAIVKK